MNVFSAGEDFSCRKPKETNEDGEMQDRLETRIPVRCQNYKVTKLRNCEL